MTTPEVFALRNREEVVRFQELNDTYAEKRYQLPLAHLSLVKAYDY